MKFAYYLAAIGEPNLMIKIETLEHNLKYIYKNINQHFDIFINIYDETTTIMDLMEINNKTKYEFINNIFVSVKKGILTELWLDNHNHVKLADYDYILFILDDIKIISMNIFKMIDIKEKYSIEFLSPKVLNSTWKYMHEFSNNTLLNNNLINDVLAITNRIEIFCMLLNYADFIKFMSINDIKNPNIWGVDYIMSHFKIKTAILYDNVVSHILKSNSNHKNCAIQMKKFLNKYGYKSASDIIRKFPNEIIEIINNP